MKVVFQILKYYRAMLANLMASSNASHAANSGINTSATSSTAQPRSSTTAVPNAFMPTSVMRQMTKNNVSIEDKHRRAGSSASGSVQTEEEKHKTVSQDSSEKRTVNSLLSVLIYGVR